MSPDLSRSHQISAIRRVRYPAMFMGYGFVWPTVFLVLIDAKRWRRVWWDRDGYFVIYENQKYRIKESELPVNRDSSLFWWIFVTVAVVTVVFLYYNWNRRF